MLEAMKRKRARRRDRTDGLMNAILPNDGSVKNLKYSNYYAFWTI
jgi:hypothetical protein